MCGIDGGQPLNSLNSPMVLMEVIYRFELILKYDDI